MRCLCRVTRVAVAVVCVLLARTAAAQEPVAATPPLDRVIGRNHVLAVPTGPCDVPWAVVNIARATGLPAGVELSPESCARQDDHDRGNDIPLLGLTVREALERVAQLDPRYMVLESSGLLLARPVEAWADKEHFLHVPVGEFSVDDENMNVAFAALMLAAGRRDAPWRDYQPVSDLQARPLFIHAGATSLYAGLNAIVQAHGELYWEVEYDCGPGRRPEAARLAVRVLELNQGGVATQAAPWRLGPDGKPVNPCPSKGQ